MENNSRKKLGRFSKTGLGLVILLGSLQGCSLEKHYITEGKNLKSNVNYTDIQKKELKKFVEELESMPMSKLDSYGAKKWINNGMPIQKRVYLQFLDLKDMEYDKKTPRKKLNRREKLELYNFRGHRYNFF